jgi:hypothetical protein
MARTALNLSAVQEIRALAPSFAQIMHRGFKTQRSRELAHRFGVNPKTIRDIWDCRSWDGRLKASEVIQDALMADSFLFEYPLDD